MKRGVIIAIVAALVVLFLIVLLVAKSNKTTTSQVTLQVWSPFDEGDTYQTISQKYLAANPNVTLDFHYIQATDEKDYEAKVVNAIAAGNGPDVWLIRNDWLPKHTTKLVPSDDVVAWSTQKNGTNKQAITDEFGAALANQNSVGDKLYGLPLAVDSLVLYINTKVINDAANELDQAGRSADAEILGEIPTTWDALATWSRLITTKDSKGNITRSGIALGTLSNTYAPTDVYLAMLYQKGGSLFQTDNKTVGFNLAKSDQPTDFPAQDALSFYTSFSSKSSPNYSWNETMGDPIQALVQGKTAMMVGYSSIYPSMLKVSKNLDSISVIPLPQQTDAVLPSQKRVDYSAYWTHVVPNTSPNKAVAWDYIKYLADSAGQEYGNATGKPDVSLMQGGTKVTIAKHSVGEAELFTSEASNATYVYKNEWQQIEQTLQTMITQVTGLGQSVQTAVDSAASSLKNISQ